METRRSPRSATHFFDDVDGHPFLIQTTSTSKNADELKLSEYLWEQTTNDHNAALQSGFVQGIKNGSLNPEAFGGYMVQDAVFCCKAVGSIYTAADRATNPFLKRFFESKCESYEKYTHSLFDMWHIENPSCIKLDTECTEYVNHEREVATTMDSLYFVVALIPCAKLWPWIGKQIKGGSFGVYGDWANANFAADDTGYKEYEHWIDVYEQRGEIDRQKALMVYSKSMKGEAGFFGSIKVN